MQIAMLGLGRMGANMAQRLLRGGHKVVVYDVAEGTAENVGSVLGSQLNGLSIGGPGGRFVAEKDIGHTRQPINVLDAEIDGVVPHSDGIMRG